MIEPVIVSSGVDWITCVTKTAQSSMLLSLHTAGLVHHEKQKGAIEKAWGMAGFSGFKCGNVEYAVRDDEYMVRLMSEAAQLSWRRCYELADSVTRFDVQVSLEMKRDCQPLVWKYYRQANRESAKKKRGPRNRVILGNDGGATLYCGERTSNRFGRVYAKGPQTKMDFYKTVLRFEVQYNGKLAKVVVRKFAGSQDERTQAINRSVQFFRERIGHVPIRTSKFSKDTCPRKRSDVQKKLLWFRESVSPSVALLLKSGMREEVLAALGLSNIMESTD